MCGLIGKIYRYPDVRQPIDSRALQRLAHRGPDGNGTYTDAYVQLGHARLSIIDLTQSGHQPMVSADGRHVITFNGEIYNYIELRAELENKGERFLSSSDTEVLLVSYKVWGPACVERFRGMFAFCIWNTETKTAFLGRDRSGEKPLFFLRMRDCLIFSSELKALLSLAPMQLELDPAAVDMYLHYQFVPEPRTLLRDVRKLPAAHTLLLSLDDWFSEPVRYWSVEDRREPDNSKSPGEIIVSVRDALEQAVAMTLRSDVPIGVALSGGIDSSAIAAFAQKHSANPLHAFCVGYPGRPDYDERAQARRFAEGLEMVVSEVELSVESFVDFFPQLITIMDEPIADPAAFGHYSVPKAASDCGIKVLLSGIGGDELFWGYSWVSQAASVNELFSSLPLLEKFAQTSSFSIVQSLLARLAHQERLPTRIRHWSGALRDISPFYTPPEQLRFYTGSPDFRDAFAHKQKIMGPALAQLGRQNAFVPTSIGRRRYKEVPAAIVRLLFDTWLVSNCLTLGDRVSMAAGVETRMPFLDYKLLDLVMGLRSQTPDHHLGQKAWLRSALKGVLPDEVLSRPKAGFQPPVHEWLGGVVKNYGGNLYNGALTAAGLIDNRSIPNLLSAATSGGYSELFFAYKVILLEMWCQTILNNRN